MVRVGVQPRPLTRREREVADLVAQGLTNRQIADRLFISERTAEGHVEQIRNKLGFHSRSQIAAWAATSSAGAPVQPSVGTSIAVGIPTRRQRHAGWASRRTGPLIAGLFVLGLLAGGVGLYLAVAPPPGTPEISTYAGSGVRGFSGDGGAASRAELSAPSAVAFDPGGGLYLADGWRVRLVGRDGTIQTVAGTGNPGFSGDGGAATSAELNLFVHSREIEPEGLAVDAAGNLYISDQKNGRIRKVVASTGVITTVAGGDGAAALLLPAGLTVAPNGDLYIAETLGNRVRVLHPDGSLITVAGTGATGFGGDGGSALAAALSTPTGVAVGLDGDLYIADTANNRIRRVTRDGTIVTVAGTGRYAFGGDGGAAVTAHLAEPTALALDARGNLYIADTGNQRVRRLDLGGTITTVAGTGVPGFNGDAIHPRNARLNTPVGLAVDANAYLYIADAGNNRIRRFALT